MKGARVPQPMYSFEGSTITKGNVSITFDNPDNIVVPKDVSIGMVNLVERSSQLGEERMVFQWGTPTEIVIQGVRLVLLSDKTKGYRRALEYQVCRPYNGVRNDNHE